MKISSDWHPLNKASQGSYSCRSDTPSSQSDQANSTLAALTSPLRTPTIPAADLSRILPAWRCGGKTSLSI